MVIQSSANTTGLNPFNFQPGSSQDTKGSASFEEQLSSAISDSLRRLGVAPGEINIKITNSGAQAAGTQILISYNAAGSSTTAGNASAATPSASQAQTASATTVAPASTQDTASASPWSPWDGPQDKRDATPVGGGQVTASGSPLIELNSTPAPNQYNYAGPAAKNPYFTTPSNPLRPGYVLGFGNWFTEPYILGANVGPIPANKMLYSTEEGAKEALRIVQQFEPDATIDMGTWGGGPFSSSVPMYYISLPGGRLISAGGILANYYNGGQGVTTDSDSLLERTLRLA